MLLPNLTGFFRKKMDFGSEKPDTRSRNLFLLKHIWVRVSITWKFQPDWSNNTLKTGFILIFGKIRSRIWNFFGQKSPPDQDRVNKKSVAKSVQPFRRRKVTSTLTYIHTNIMLLCNRDYNALINNLLLPPFKRTLRNVAFIWI